MRCMAPHCPEPRKGLLYAADGMHICMACGEIWKNHRHVQLDEFAAIDPRYQKEVGRLLQTIRENLGRWNYLKDQGVQIQRG